MDPFQGCFVLCRHRFLLAPCLFSPSQIRCRGAETLLCGSEYSQSLSTDTTTSFSNVQRLVHVRLRLPCCHGCATKRVSSLRAVAMLSLYHYRALLSLVVFVALLGAWYAFGSEHSTGLLPSGVLEKQEPPLPRPSHSAVASDEWVFDPQIHARHYGLTNEQCDASFPGLWLEIERAAAHRHAIGNITPQDVDISWRGDGIVRAMVHDHQVRTSCQITWFGERFRLTQLDRTALHHRSQRL